MFSFTSPIPGIRVVVQVPILLPLLRSGFLRGGMAGIRGPCPSVFVPLSSHPKTSKSDDIFERFIKPHFWFLNFYICLPSIWHRQWKIPELNGGFVRWKIIHKWSRQWRRAPRRSLGIAERSSCSATGHQVSNFVQWATAFPQRMTYPTKWLGAQLKIKIVGQAIDYGDYHFSRFQD